ncbi:hypothetical protein PIB30_039825 [Stylosanthes scabra]|uniref:Uncharacterized protein n=1 Tax=Stylosanthes scabra TaxID=79078 RepID=A0ABU6REI6_9FABA|nr:hypothetical protein [Stylosanthes scabra]
MKFQEVKEMGFRCLEHISDWKVKHNLMIALAQSYNKNQMSMVLETGDVPVTAPMIGLALGLPARGESFPELNQKKYDVQREYFRRCFILFVMKSFFFASSAEFITEFHIPAVIDILYVHNNMHGPLKQYSGATEPWTKEWSAKDLDVVAREETIRPSGLIRKVQELRKFKRVNRNVDDSNNRTQMIKKDVHVKRKTIRQTRKNSKKITKESREGLSAQSDVNIDCETPTPLTKENHTDDHYIPHEYANAEHDSDDDPTMPSFKLLISEDEIDASDSLSPSTMDFNDPPPMPTRRKLGLLEKLDVRPSSRILRQPSKLEPVPEKSDNVRSENPQPMDSQYG